LFVIYSVLQETAGAASSWQQGGLGVLGLSVDIVKYLEGKLAVERREQRQEEHASARQAL